MKKTIGVAGLALAALLAGCVTVNVYFPAAEAQRAADEIIDTVTGGAGAPAQSPQSKRQTPPAATPPSSDSGSAQDGGSVLLAAAARMLDLLVPAANAQERADLNISTPEIRAIIGSMRQRFLELKPYFASGAIGLTAAGTIAVRDQNGVPLAQRATLARLVAQQNQDLSLLYAQIAAANGHPEWSSEIRSVFAQRWVAHASQNGWYYRDSNGSWTRGGPSR